MPFHRHYNTYQSTIPTCKLPLGYHHLNRNYSLLLIRHIRLQYQRIPHTSDIPFIWSFSRSDPPPNHLSYNKEKTPIPIFLKLKMAKSQPPIQPWKLFHAETQLHCEILLCPGRLILSDGYKPNFILLMWAKILRRTIKSWSTNIEEVTIQFLASII